MVIDKEWDTNKKILSFEEIRILDQENILNALKKTGWKVFGQDGAAQLMGTSPTTLLSRIKKLNIRKPHYS